MEIDYSLKYPWNIPVLSLFLILGRDRGKKGWRWGEATSLEKLITHLTGERVPSQNEGPVMHPHWWWIELSRLIRVIGVTSKGKVMILLIGWTWCDWKLWPGLHWFPAAMLESQPCRLTLQKFGRGILHTAKARLGRDTLSTRRQKRELGNGTYGGLAGQWSCAQSC